MEETRANQALHHRWRRIEHVNSSVKRCRIVKDRIRLWKEGVRDLVMELVLCPVQLPSPSAPVATDGLIGINSHEKSSHAFQECHPYTGGNRAVTRGPTGMTVGPDVAQAALSRLSDSRELDSTARGGVDLTPASSRRDHQRGWGAGRLTVRLDSLFTCVPGELTGRTDKGFGIARALMGWRDWREWCRSSCSRFRWLQPVQHQEHPYQGDQPKLVENDVG